MQCLSHFIRMRDGRSTKKTYNGKIIKKRIVGRARKRWVGEVKKVLKKTILQFMNERIEIRRSTRYSKGGENPSWIVGPLCMYYVSISVK